MVGDDRPITIGYLFGSVFGPEKNSSSSSFLPLFDDDDEARDRLLASFRSKASCFLLPELRDHGALWQDHVHVTSQTVETRAIGLLDVGLLTPGQGMPGT